MTGPSELPLPRHSLDDPTPWYRKYAKALGAFLGVTPPQTVFAILEANGIHVNGWLNLAITVVLGTAAAAIAPKNQE